MGDRGRAGAHGADTAVDRKPELWRIMAATGAPYDEFQAKADREIPVVLEPG
jgi:F420H(2)-dependent quinone reductase